MEKPSKQWGIKTWMKFLSKAAQPRGITFQSPPPSPRRSSSPMVRLIPCEARRKGENGMSFASKEPTSPMVSCMGQVKGKKKKKSRSESKTTNRVCLPSQENTGCTFLSCVFKEAKKKKAFRFLSNVPKVALPEEGKHDAFVGGSSGDVERVPSLGQMKRFSSGRGAALADFDLILEVHDDQLGGVRHGEGGEKDQDHEKKKKKKKKKKKEVGLSKRRTLSAHLAPLQL